MNDSKMDYAVFDTSALVKRYYEEPGSERVDVIIESDETTVLITTLSVIEAVSAFRRKRSIDDIPERTVYALVGAFFREALSDFLIVPLEDPLLEHCFDLVLADDLRTLDSIQLSAALSLDAELNNATFVCADSDLIGVAADRGLATTNPTESA